MSFADLSAIRSMSRIVVFTILTVSVGSCASQRGNLEASETDPCAAPVTTAEGRLAGVRLDDGICSWKGVTFASSGPEFRFRKPGPAPKLQGVQDATDFGKGCLAPVLEFMSPAGVDEDCLNLNIWRPETIQPGTRLPVMIFFYGGAFILGGGSWMVYDGANLAKQEVMVITLNYRLGALGFYGSPAQQASDPAGASGNWAIWDQIAALQWVRNNIAAFGGDAANVTIFGESAGGYSVCALLASPAAAGLFDRAIMESGGCLSHSLAELHEGSKELLSRTPCAGRADEMACLRGADAADLNMFQMMWRGAAPAVDGVLLKEQPIAALRNGNANKVPLLVGANRDELRPLTLLPNVAWDLSKSVASYWNSVSKALGESESATLRTLYPDQPGVGARELWVAMVDDVFFKCNVAWSADAHSKAAPVYAYEFDLGERKSFTEKQMGAYHSSELPYIFGFLGWPRVMQQGSQAEAAAYSRRIQKYWSTFARTGNPNAPGVNPWPAYGDSKTIVRLQPGLATPMPGYLEKRCAYWHAQGSDTLPKHIMMFSRYSGATGVTIGEYFGLEQ